MVKRMILN